MNLLYVPFLSVFGHCVFSVWSPASSHTPSGLLILLYPSHDVLTWLPITCASHSLPLCPPHTHIHKTEILTLLRMCWICDSLHHIIFTTLCVVCLSELLSLQSGSINITQWIGSYSSSSSCLRLSPAGSLAQWVCILNAPLASMREMIGRINCGWRAEWE